MTMGERINIATFNVNGAGANKKRKEIFHYLHVKNLQVIFLQETHSSPKTANRWAIEFGSKIYFSHGDTQSRGVAILINRSLKVVVHNINTDKEGRYIIMYATINKKKFILANIYAPNIDDTQFFSNAFDIVKRYSPDYTIIGGDFNVALNPLLDRQGTHVNHDKSATWLNMHFDNNELVDIWRHFNKEKVGFTWRKHYKHRNITQFSRLDYLIISESLLQFVNAAEILPAFLSDHNLVKMSLHFNPTG